jgi:hypothetical protein
MARYCSLIVLALILFDGSVSAEGSHAGTPEQQRACRPDVLRYCRQLHDDFAVADCLRAHVTALRGSCRKVIQGG